MLVVVNLLKLGKGEPHRSCRDVVGEVADVGCARDDEHAWSALQGRCQADLYRVTWCSRAIARTWAGSAPLGPAAPRSSASAMKHPAIESSPDMRRFTSSR